MCVTSRKLNEYTHFPKSVTLISITRLNHLTILLFFNTAVLNGIKSYKVYLQTRSTVNYNVDKLKVQLWKVLILSTEGNIIYNQLNKVFRRGL